MKKIYISHPYSASPEMNRKNAREITGFLAKHYPMYLFVNPIDLFQGQSQTIDDDTILKQAVEVMKDCDGVIFCEGWQKSKGCRLEHFVASRVQSMPRWLGAEAFVRNCRGRVNYA